MERKPRAYKIADNKYLTALKKANKNNFPLATMIEMFVVEFSNNDMTILDTIDYLKNLKKDGANKPSK
jgi:hypothetical protein